MANETLIFQCQSCKQWSPSPIQADRESFKTMGMSGNTTNCPKCGKMTPLDKANMKFTGGEHQFGTLAGG